MGEPRPTLPTRLAHAGYDEHRLRGRLLFGELLGETSLWSLLSICAGGPPLDARASAVWDDLAVVCAVADPHIWPLKLVRLAATYGSPIAGLGAAHLFTDRALVGPGAAGGCARQLAELARALGPRADDQAAVDAALAARPSGERLLGFGVPYRERDERVEAVRPRLAAHGCLGGTHWRLLDRVDAFMVRTRRLPVNIVGAMSAVGLDLGVPPAAVEALAVAALFPPLLGNAWESAEQRAPALERLDERWIEYRGAPPRVSPRGVAAALDPPGPTSGAIEK